MPDYSDEEALVFPSSDQENMATEPYEGSYDGQSEPADNEAQWQPEVVELFHQYDMNPSGFEQEEYMFSDDPYQEGMWTHAVHTCILVIARVNCFDDSILQ